MFYFYTTSDKIFYPVRVNSDKNHLLTVDSHFLCLFNGFSNQINFTLDLFEVICRS